MATVHSPAAALRPPNPGPPNSGPPDPGPPNSGPPDPRITRGRPKRGGRIAAAVLGAVLVAGGGGATGAYALQQSEGGYFMTPAASFATPTSALVTDEIMVEAGRPGNPPNDVGDLSQVRIRATPTNPGEEIFVGIGPKAEVEEYLRGVSNDRMASFQFDPFTVQFDRSPGGAAPAPADQPFWVATASGPGTQTLLWDKANGAWSAVIMNADGSPVVDMRADLGLRFGFLLPVGVVLLGAGLLVVLVGAVRPAVRDRRGRVR